MWFALRLGYIDPGRIHGLILLHGLWGEVESPYGYTEILEKLGGCLMAPRLL